MHAYSSKKLAVRLGMEIVMEKFLSTATAILASLTSRSAQAIRFSCDFCRDPLAHPTLTAMSLTQLADLPAGELRARGRC